MTISASLVKELRDLSGAGMMECKSALVEAEGDISAAQDLLRKRGQSSADKKSARIAAEGRIAFAQNEDKAVLVEVNSETDFVARDKNFIDFADASAEAVFELRTDESGVDKLLAAETKSGGTLDQARIDLVAKLGENIGVRQFRQIAAKGEIGYYLHQGSKIGVIVDVTGGDADLRKDLAMHIAASAPACIAEKDVPKEQLERERTFLTEQAGQEGKPPEIVAKMVEGRMRKYLSEITLLGQPFVKDPDISVEKLLKQHGASINSYARFEVGEGIEKKAENFAEEVKAQVDATG
jgi:elongation factor Ts